MHAFRLLSKLVREEFRSTASVSFFLVIALVIGASVSWYEHGGAERYAQAAAAQQVAGTSTAMANLPQ